MQLIYFLVLILHALPSFGTPTLALKEAENCAGCHNPGRGQRPVLERRCTLDCQGCHIDPAGGGARNQWGKYYSYNVLSSVQLFQVQDPLQDLSYYDLHFDGRYMRMQEENSTKQFPMGAELTLRVRPFVNYLHLIYGLQALGRSKSEKLLEDDNNSRRFREKFAVMIDQLPMNLYLKAFRGQPNYGLRRPNHSLWIRERIGLDQFALTDGLEFGGTPNVPFFRATLMEGNPEDLEADRQKGYSAHGGFRGVTMAWHLNASLWKTSSEKTQIDMQAFGLGANFNDFIVYAERNWREVNKTVEYLNNGGINEPVFVHPSSKISELQVSYAGLHGLLFNVYLEQMKYEDEALQRKSVSMNVHLLPGLQLELWRRKNETLRLMDTLMILHLYFDI
ncbi:MAG: hypothetical protein KBD78_02305 [Oligoflexales bacterium]|nr:hypothetical protein [Oligoflexales bacterium]